MLGLKRTCRCAELGEANVGQTVTVMGWVAKQRNKGGLVFVKEAFMNVLKLDAGN